MRHIFYKRYACTETQINTIDTTGKCNTTGPIVYLLKLIVHEAGFSCLKKVLHEQGEQLKWVVPQGLARNEVRIIIVIYTTLCILTVFMSTGRKDIGSICIV